jgi:hypothetical protein
MIKAPKQGEKDNYINFLTPTSDSSWFASAWFTSGLKIGRQLTFVSIDAYSAK